MKVKFTLTKAQSEIVKPLFDELAKLNIAAFWAGKEMAGATIVGQLFWYENFGTQTAELTLLDPDTSTELYAVLKTSCEKRTHDNQA